MRKRARLFKDAAFTLEGLRWAESRREAEINWSDPHAVAEWRARRYAQSRDAALPGDLRCPACGEKKMDPKQWVYSPVVTCRGCSTIPQKATDLFPVSTLCFVLAEKRWKVEGVKRMSLRDQAMALGVSYSSWYRYATGSAKTMTDSWKERLDECGMLVRDPGPAHKWKVSSDLGETRRLIIGIKNFAKLCGWSVTRQRAVEQENAVVTHETRDKVLDTLLYLGVETLDVR